MKFIYQAIGSVLSFFDFGSYLLAIMIFAIIVKLLLLPLSIKQQKNMQKQATLRPKEMAIRKKYKGQEQNRDAMMRMQTEIQEMYRANNFNQFAGCLPMLIQLPILIIIYQVIVNPLSYICRIGADTLMAIRTTIANNLTFFNLTEAVIPTKGDFVGVYGGTELELTTLLQNSEYFDFIASEVTELANFTLPNFGSLGAIPTFTSILVLVPIITFLVQFGSMKLTRKLTYQPVDNPNQGCSNVIMDVGMPLMMTFMAFNFPALLGIYWIFQSVIGVVQQYILKKVYPMPTFTDEDYREAERTLRGKGSGANRNFDSGKKYRSLHNIDADDE